MARNTDVDDYLSGKKLYGDDLSYDALLDWYKSEEEGYANLGAKDRSKYRYEYHELNRQLSFRFIGDRRFNAALGIGSAYGDEFFPIIGQLRHITILDPSEAFSHATDIKGTPCTYVKPNISGDLPFADGKFDLIVCFGVMHHIPNVTHVMSEIYRCLSTGGLFLIREPIVSQGDWRQPRAGVTLNERGIPEQIFARIIADLKFTVINRALCDFRPIPLLARKFGIDAYNNRIAVKIDSLVSNELPWKTKYHRTTSLQKLLPASVAYVLKK